MIKITMDNGFFYKGDVLDENEEWIILKDITGKTVEIRKSNISVKEIKD